MHVAKLDDRIVISELKCVDEVVLHIYRERIERRTEI